jgi:hypothetical protein
VWIEAASVRSEIFGHLEKQQQAARAAAERARVAPAQPPPPRRRWPDLQEKPFDGM